MADARARATRQLAGVVEKAADKDAARAAVAAAAPELVAAVRQTEEEAGVDDRLRFETLRAMAGVGEAFFKAAAPRLAADLMAAVTEILVPRVRAENAAPGGRGAATGGKAVVTRLYRAEVWVSAGRANGTGTVVRGG